MTTRCKPVTILCTPGILLASGLLTVCLSPASFGGAISAGGAVSASTRPEVKPLSPLQQCTDRMLQSVANAEALLPQMSAAADVVAKRWIAGAELFVGGDTSFSDEIFYRAGGLIAVRRIGPARKSNGRTMPLGDVPKESVVLYGLHRNADANLFVFEELANLAGKRDTVVLFASGDWPITRKALQAPPAELASRQGILPRYAPAR